MSRSQSKRFAKRSSPEESLGDASEKYRTSKCIFGLADEVEKNSVCDGLDGMETEAVSFDIEARGASLRHLIMSTRTRGVAVAVKAMIGTGGRIRVSFSHRSSLYAGLKSWPHSLGRQ